MALILLRHTRPEGAEGLCYGRTDLAPDAGFERDAASILRELPPVGRIVTSPLRRCRLLAERIAAARQMELTIDPRLVEFDFGSWEGKPWSLIPRPELDAWSADFQGARPHGGECVAMLAARVGAALDEFDPTGPAVLWVSHAGVVRAACALIGVHEGWETQLGFGQWLILHPAPNGDRARTSPSRDR